MTGCVDDGLARVHSINPRQGNSAASGIFARSAAARFKLQPGSEGSAGSRAQSALLRSASRIELQSGQTGVETALPRQTRVAALLDDAAAIQDDDPVRLQHCG